MCLDAKFALEGGENMTTRLEIERLSFQGSQIVKSREIIAELEDITGKHETDNGTIGLEIKQVGHRCGYNNDLVLDFSKSNLQKLVLAKKRRISIGRDNNKGSQQIANGITLFVSTGLHFTRYM